MVLETKAMDERQAVLRWLAGLADKAFAEFFYEAVRERKTCDGPGHFVLADAALMDGRWYVDLVGVHDAENYDGSWADDAAICQSGKCESCDSEVRSWAKRAICPVCGSKVYAT
jgi:hypothetical protein